MFRLTVFLAVFVAFLVAVVSTQVSAEITYYVGPDQGSWHVPENWSSGQVPGYGTGTSARIFDDKTVLITEDVSEFTQLTVGHTRDGTVIQNDGHTEARFINLGESKYQGTYVMNGGRLTTRYLNLGSSIDSSGVFTQNGGLVIFEDRLRIGIFGQGVVNLGGGVLTSKSGSIMFGTAESSYLNFGGGALNLPGDWDFNRLVGISSSDFRFFGNSASEGDLRFDLVLIGNDVYTQVSAIPEPSTFVLLILAAVCLAWKLRR